MASIPGESYGFARKLQVAVEIEIQKVADQLISINAIAKQCHVSWFFVNKVNNEIIEHGRVLRPFEICVKRDVPRGPGSLSLDKFDKFILLQLLQEEPSRGLKSYADSLYDYTCTRVSRSTISRWFLYAFPIKGSLVKPNLVPYDKFRPENEARAYEYLFMLSHFAPHRVKFGDEKSLKGQELFLRYVRRNPATGHVAPIMTESDFRNTHSVTGFCSM